jgi:hypothetical protein
MILLYILMLIAHIGHVTEEILGHFFLIEKIGGAFPFLVINIFLFGVVLFLFVSTIRGKRWAYKLSIVYAALMIINGLGHNLMTIVAGEYYGGYAGGFSGIALILFGIPLIYSIRRKLSMRPQS